MANKIIGGSETSVVRHPYTGVLYDEFGTYARCTGFLIAPNLVLTEASCASSKVSFGCSDATDISTCEEVIDVADSIQDDEDFSYFDPTDNLIEFTNTGLAFLILAEDSVQPPVKILDMHEDMFEDHFVSTVLSFGINVYSSALSNFNENLLEAEVTLVEGKPCLAQYTSIIDIKNSRDPYAMSQLLADDYFCSEQISEDVQICGDPGAGAILKCESDHTQDILLGLNLNKVSCETDGIPTLYSKMNSFEVMGFIKHFEDRIEFTTMNSCPNGFTTTNVAPTPYPTITNRWYCEAAKFGANFDCDCNCGQFDPDCLFLPAVHVVGCLPDQTCNLDGNCVFDNALEPSVPASWICDPAFYDDGEFCDCNCGAVDPDCAATEFVRGCLPEQTCGSTGRCEGEAKAIPAAWQCVHSFYGTFDGCDCNCGAPDPDCSVEGQEIVGCSEDKPFCLGGQCYNAKQATEAAEGEETKTVSVTFDGTILGVAFLTTVAFIVHTVFKKTKSQAKDEVVISDVDHTL